MSDSLVKLDRGDVICRHREREGHEEGGEKRDEEKCKARHGVNWGVVRRRAFLSVGEETGCRL